MDWEPEIKDSGYLPEKGKPTEETVCYKIGGTYYEVSTSCGGSERLRDKMIRRYFSHPRQDSSQT